MPICAHVMSHFPFHRRFICFCCYSLCVCLSLSQYLSLSLCLFLWVFVLFLAFVAPTVCRLKKENIFVFCRINIFGRAWIFNWILLLFLLPLLILLLSCSLFFSWWHINDNNATCWTTQSHPVVFLFVMCSSSICKALTDLQWICRLIYAQRKPPTGFWG